MSNVAAAACSSSPQASAGSITTSSPGAMPSTPATDGLDAARAVGAERHRHRRGGLPPDPPVAAVERGGDELDDDLAGRRSGVGELVDLEAGLAPGER